MQRSNEVDFIRTAALIGICVVNIPFMALPAEAIFIPPDNWQDKVSAFFVEAFLQLKFFILFSFIFGWGMAIQEKSARSKGNVFAKHYFRRMLGLAILGTCHAILVFSGDILLLYAILGCLLWLLKDWPPRSLVKMAICMLPLSMCCLTALAFLIGMAVDVNSLATTKANLGSSFWEATQVRLTDWPSTFIFLLFLQGPLAFGAFALGLAAEKSRFFIKNSDGLMLLRKNLPTLIIIALPLNLLFAAVVGGIIPESYEWLSLLGFVSIAIGAPALSAAYLYTFILLSRKLHIPQIIVLAGRNSLSTYIMQGVLAGVVFGAYGFGYFDQLGHTYLLLLSLLIALTAMLSVGIYARFFGRGPLEPVLRKISE